MAECLCCLEVIPSVVSAETTETTKLTNLISCCLKPLCDQCATAVTQGNLVCPSCSQNCSLTSRATSLVWDYLQQLASDLRIKLDSAMTKLAEALFNLRTDQADNEAKVATLRQRITVLTKSSDHYQRLLQQTSYHDKNFQVTIEHNQAQLKQLGAVAEYLNQLTVSIASQLPDFSTILSQLAEVNRRLTDQPIVLTYDYQPLEYLYHPSGSSIGVWKTMKKLRHFWSNYDFDLTAEKSALVKTVTLVTVKSTANPNLGQYRRREFADCCDGCLSCDSCLSGYRDSALVEFQYYQAGYVIIHYREPRQGLHQPPIITTIATPGYLPYRINCRYVILAALESVEGTAMPVQQLRVAAVSANPADLTTTAILQSPSQHCLMEVVLTSDKILAITAEGIVAFDLSTWLDQSVLVGKLILAMTRIVSLQPCGIYFSAQLDDYNWKTGQTDQPAIFYNKHSATFGLSDCHEETTGFGQIDVDTLTQLHSYRKQYSQDFLVLDDGSIIFEEFGQIGLGGDIEYYVTVWRNGSWCHRSVGKLSGLTKLDLSLSRQGQLRMYRSDLNVVEFY